MNVVTQLKKKFPHIKRIYVRAEYAHINEDYRIYLLSKYDDTYYPERVLNAGKAVYVERNYLMIDNSSYCVIYYDENYTPTNRKEKRTGDSFVANSGTMLAYNYAQKKNVKIINVK